MVVVGGGAAGLAAALEASADFRVFLLEGQDQLGGSARLAQAVTVLPGEEGLAAWDARGGGPNPRRQRYVRAVQSDVVAWSEGYGLTWTPVPDQAGLGLPLVSPIGGGQQLVRVLDGAARDAGVEIQLGRRVQGLDRHERWTVSATGGEPLQADAVILATGGFMANPGLARKILGAGAGTVLAGAPRHADGNGLGLARNAGGAVADPLGGLFYGHGVPNPRQSTQALMIIGAPGGYTLDLRGTPVPGLLDDVDAAAQRIWALPGRKAWVLYDGERVDGMWLWDVHNNRNVEAAGVAKALSLRHADAAGLARAIGVPTSSVEAGLSASGGPLTGKGGLVALPLFVSTAKSTTGVLTDLDGRVLDGDGEPVPGLYAAGELTGFGDPYQGAVLDSTMVAGAVLTGRDAARALSADRGK